MMPSKNEDSQLHEIVQKHYCVCGPDGYEDERKVKRVLDALTQARKGEFPDIEGVPRLKGRIDEVDEIPRFVRKFLPVVEKDPQMHALSFVDPLRLATDVLGLAISPRVSRVVRRSLRGVVSFDVETLKKHGTIAGVAKLRWRLKEA